MSDYRSVAAWCEFRPGRGYETTEAWFPRSIAYWPKSEIKFGASMVRAAYEACRA